MAKNSAAEIQAMAKNSAAEIQAMKDDPAISPDRWLLVGQRGPGQI